MNRKESYFLVSILVALFFCTSAFATQFSSVATGGYSNPFTWDVLGASGIPGAADTVTINHFVSVSGTRSARNLIISAPSGDLWQAGSTFDLFGSHTCNGKHSGTGTLNFRAASASLVVPVSGSFDFGGTIRIHGTTTLSAASQIKFLFGNISILAGASFVNNGTMWTRGTVSGVDGTASFVQGVNARLYVHNTFMATGHFDASTLGNFVYYWGDKKSYSVYDSDVNYRDVFFRNTGSYTLTIAENLDVNGFCYEVLSAHVYTGANTIDVSGDFITWQANFPTGEGNVTFSGSSTQRIYDGSGFPLSTINFGDLTLTGDTVRPEIELIVNGDLTINAGKVLDLTTFSTPPSLGGDLTNSGSFNYGTMVVKAIGSSTQSWTTTPDLTFEQFEVNKTGGTLTLSAGVYDIDSVLTLTGGSFNPNNRMTLLSDATRTARLAQVTGGSFTGNLVMERYVGNRSANYQDLAAPGSSTIGDWDVELFTSGINGNEGNAFGTNGIFYSIWYYTEATAGFDSLFATTNALTAMTGYELWLGSNLDTMLADTFDTRGIPFIGPQSKALTFTNAHGWHLVGNPFASWIEWDSVFANTATIDNAFFILDAASGTYAAYGAGDRIPPSQGFWVHCTAATTLNIPENAKSSSLSSTFYRTPNAYEEAIRLKLSSNLNPFYNEAVVRFDAEASDEYDPADALFRKSPVETAPAIRTVSADGHQLTRNAQSILCREASIPVVMEVGVSGTYQLDVSGLDQVTHFSCVVLEDKVTGLFHDLRQQSHVAIDIDSKESSTRFALHLAIDGYGPCNDQVWTPADPTSHITVNGENHDIIVSIENPEPQDVTIAVYNSLGQKVSADVLRADVVTDYLRLGIGAQAGVYVVVVDTETTRKVEKVYLH